MILSQNIKRRFYEILPGALVWITLIGSVVFSFISPIAVIYFVIIFDVYWLLRIIYYIPFLFSTWFRYRAALKRNWQSDAEKLPGYGDIYHLVMLPTWREDVDVIRTTMENLLACSTPSDRILVCLGGEEADKEHFEENARIIWSEYQSRFKKLVITLHPNPAGKEDEIQGKGSNLNWMARQMVPAIEELEISPDSLIVSSFDVDTLAHPHYFSCLTYTYLTTPNSARSSYQPVLLYNNNLWEAKAPIRVAMFGTTFWLMSELARPERMMTFSSHSMSWRMLLDVGFWQKDIVSEDSRIFLQAFVHYHGAYRVTPIYLPVSVDSVDSVGYVDSLKALYKQMRRWAWGVENFPYMTEHFAGDKQMPFRLKAAYIWKQLEGMYTWATAPLLITLLGQLPFWFAPDSYRSYAIFQNTPFTLQWLMRFALIGAIISATLALTILPPVPSHVHKAKAFLITIVQWALLPVTFVVFGSLPAIDAQTRHLLGGRFRLGFNVTAKFRKGK
ncbi:MAG: glycosyltransferase family 2 protein [Patescibacteria group bacterium]